MSKQLFQCSEAVVTILRSCDTIITHSASTTSNDALFIAGTGIADLAVQAGESCVRQSRYVLANQAGVCVLDTCKSEFRLIVGVRLVI
jgi:hypothetical protein